MKTFNEAISYCNEKAKAFRGEAKIYSYPHSKYCIECAEEYEQLAEWLENLDEARKIIWDTSLEDACKIMKLRKLIDHYLERDSNETS